MPHFDIPQRRFVAGRARMGNSIYGGRVVAFRCTRVMRSSSGAVGAAGVAQRARERSSRDHEATRDDQQTPNHDASIARAVRLDFGVESKL